MYSRRVPVTSSRGSSSTRDADATDLRATSPGGAGLAAYAAYAPGDVIGGAYEVLSLLGHGGDGAVFEAKDRVLGRVVAVKVSSEVGWLKNEAVSLAAIRHPGLPVVHAFGVERALAYLVFERVRGVELAVEQRRRAGRGESFSIAEVLAILTSLADALAAVHRAGLVHRDIKPENVLLTPDGRTVLVDFGLVSSARDATSDASADLCAGTPLYMAPETILKSVKAGAAHLLDVYAFGVVAFELLTSRPPFECSNTVELFLAHVESPPPSPASLRRDTPAALAALIVDLLEKDPQSRPESMDAVLVRLRAIRAPRPPDPPVRVLVVDDDPTMRTRIELIVRRAVPDAEVATAHGGDSALDRIAEAAPDVMLVDLEMPGMNGVELCFTLRATSLADRCTLILVSAAAEEGDVELLYRLGVAHFVPKGEHLTRQLVPLLQSLRRD